MSGDEPLGLGDATSALQELADLEELESTLGQDYAGASLEDIDEEARRRALGRKAVDDLEELRRIERELERQGYLLRTGGELELSPRGVRRHRPDRAAPGLRRLTRPGPGRPRHPRRGRRRRADRRLAGRGGSATSSRSTSCARCATPCCAAVLGAWATRRAAGRRRLRGASRPSAARPLRSPAGRPVVLDGAARHLGRGEDDRARAARAGDPRVPAGRHAGHRLRDYARRCGPSELAGLSWDMVQGTNLQHALMLAGDSSTSTPTPSRSCWSSPTASRPPTCCPTAAPSSTGRRCRRRSR